MKKDPLQYVRFVKPLWVQVQKTVVSAAFSIFIVGIIKASHFETLEKYRASRAERMGMCNASYKCIHVVIRRKDRFWVHIKMENYYKSISVSSAILLYDSRYTVSMTCSI